MSKISLLLKALLIILFISDSYSQFSTVHISGYGSTDFNASFIKFSDGAAGESAILGTPYIHKDWMFGELVLDTDLSIETMFRYNLEAQNIELIFDSDTLIFLHPLRMKEFRFMGKRFIYDVSIGSDRGGEFFEASYLEVLVDGHSQLLKKYEKYRSSSSNSIRYAAAEVSKESYQTQTVLYIRPTPEEAPVRISGKGRSVLKILPDGPADLGAFVRSNSLRLNSEDQLIRLIEYSNSLMDRP